MQCGSATDVSTCVRRMTSQLMAHEKKATLMSGGSVAPARGEDLVETVVLHVSWFVRCTHPVGGAGSSSALCAELIVQCSQFLYCFMAALNQTNERAQGSSSRQQLLW